MAKWCRKGAKKWQNGAERVQQSGKMVQKGGKKSSLNGCTWACTGQKGSNKSQKVQTVVKKEQKGCIKGENWAISKLLLAP